jgi:hypothetical protein
LALPSPLDPDLIEIHPAFEEAVQAQRREVPTSMSPLRAREFTVRVVGSMVYVHVGGGGAGAGAGGAGDGAGPGLGPGAGGGGAGAVVG